MNVIDAVDWGALGDAYGPAVDVPYQLRALASADADEARRALGDLYAGIFHQGSYYSAAAPAVPLLVDAVARALPRVKPEIALFLGDLAAVHATPQLAFEPWVFRSNPGAPDYPAAVATVEAVRAARPAFVGWLDADEPTLRAVAAFVLSGLDPRSADALATRLAVETEPTVRATLRLALTGLGHHVDDAAGSALEAECEAAARALGDRAVDGDLERLEALAARAPEERARLPFMDGDPCALACTAMLTLARSRGSEVFAAARRALAARLARGERPAGPPPSTVSRLVAPLEAPRAPWNPDTGAALGALARVMATIAFGERLDDRTPLRRDALDDDQRAVLALTADHDIPVPVRGAPWFTAATMRRFLTGGGPLDRELTLDGVTAPVVHHLAPRSESGPENLARVERVGEALGPDACLDVLEDVLAGGYAVGGTLIAGHLLGRLIGFVEPHLDALAPRLDAFAVRCAASPDDVSPEEARLALLPFERARRAPPEPWDPLVAISLALDPAARRGWLDAFSPARQANIAAWSSNAWIFDRLRPDGAAEEVDRAIVARFVDPGCGWWEYDAAAMLARVRTLDALLDLRGRVDGRRAKALDEAIRERTREGHHGLRLSRAGDAIDATLTDAGGRVRFAGALPAAPRVPDLEPIAAALPDRARAVISLTGELDHTTRYAIQRHLGDLGVGEVRDGGSSLRRA